MIPPQLLLIIAILTTGFGAGWTVNGWRLNTQMTEVKLAASQEKADGLQKALDQTGKWKKEYDDAIKEAQSRVVRNGAAAANARAESDRLRTQLTDANARLANAPADAVRRYANTCNELLGSVEEAGRGIAEKADGHLADVLKLQGAWPK